MHAKQKSGRKNDENGTDDPMQLPDPFSQLDLQQPVTSWHIRRGLPSLSITKETSWLVRISSETCSLVFKVTVKCCESSYLQ